MGYAGVAGSGGPGGIHSSFSFLGPGAHAPGIRMRQPKRGGSTRGMRHMGSSTKRTDNHGGKDMMEKHWLQLFAEGEGGQTGGETAPDAGEQTLEQLGVPAELIAKRAKRTPHRAAPAAQKQEPQRDAAAEQPEKEKPAVQKRMTWDEIMADPEYNRQMQETVRQRLKDSRGAEERLHALDPAMQILAQRYGLQDAADSKALAKAILEDNSFYEDKAAQMGVEPDVARRIDQMERFEQQREAEAQRSEQEKAMREHFRSLAEQEAELKKTVPDFDLQRELQNPTFLRMTAPGSGLRVADVYFALHRQELQEAARKQAAQEAAQKISASVRAGSSRPVENGVSSQAPSTGSIDYAHMTRAQRQALKDEILRAAARGEKIYPQ